MSGLAARLASPGFEAGSVPRVSVVIATHSRSQLIPDVLAALQSQTLGTEEFEVVVVDDASTDDTWSVLERCAAGTTLRLKCVRLGVNSGAGGARTVGVNSARAEVVAFTDDDCLPDSSWLERLIAPFDAGGDVVVQGRTVSWPGDAAEAGPWARTVWVLGPTWLFETCNVAYRRADVQAVGGFPGRDEAPATVTGRPTGEDALLGWKVVDRGAALVFAPDALVHHRNVPGSWWQWVREQRGRAVFPALAARSPYARRAFWARWFLGPRSAATALGVASLGLWVFSRKRRWLWGVAPWVTLALPEAHNRPGRPEALRLVQLAVVDVAGLAATLRSSIRHRKLVL